VTPEQAFGLALRDLRKEKRHSQHSLSEACGLHRTYVGLLERGRYSPSLATIVALAEALETTPDDLMRRMLEVLESG
jgi:transcriptional regulator with XRE-family HTH domain